MGRLDSAHDDPSGIATYSQAGAQFGYGTLWAMLLTLPVMIAVQEACMRIGAVTGKGLAAVIRDTYPEKSLYPIVFLVEAANTVNIGSDIGAMAIERTLVPHIVFNSDFLFVVVAIFGTTISPYLFFWQTSNIVEDEVSENRTDKSGAGPRIMKSYLR